MITLATREGLSVQERSQFERRELARGAWVEGRIDDALLILDTVLSEEMTPRVAASCFVTEAAFKAEQGDYPGSLESLTKAAPHIDQADNDVRGSFFNQRARLHKELGKFNAALLDYAGASASYEDAGRKDYLAGVANNVAGVCLAIGDLPRAKASIDQAIAEADKSNSEFLSQAYDTQANICLARGELEQALTSVRMAISLAGNNETWLKTFQATEQKVIKKLLELLGVSNVKDIERLQIQIVKQALLEHKGRRILAAQSVGMSREGIDYLVNHKDELVEFRKEKRVRRKTVILNKG